MVCAFVPYLGNLWLTQGDKEFFLCFILELLQLYIIHLVLCDILSSFLYTVQGTIGVLFLFFFFAYKCPTVPTSFFHFLSPLAPLILCYQLLSLYSVFQESYLTLTLAKNWVLSLCNKTFEGFRKNEREGKKERARQTDCPLTIFGLPAWCASLREHEPLAQPRLRERSESGVLPGEGIIRRRLRNRARDNPHCIRLS